mgnify:CR=1 FL=1
MANPNLVRKPAYDVNGLGEASPLDIVTGASRDQNFIHNGAMDFFQRGASASVTTEINGPADRWSVGRTSGSVVATVSASTDVPANGKSFFSLQWQTTTAAAMTSTDRIGIFQKIEGQFARVFYNETVTLSFWVKSALTGVHSVWFGNGAAANGFYITSYTINTPNTWEYKTITVNMANKIGTWSTDNTIGMYVYFSLGAAVQTATANTWTSSTASLALPGQVNLGATVGNQFKITQVMLNIGSVPAPFVTAGRTFDNELKICQRYYEVGNYIASGYNGGAGVIPTSSCSFLVTKRAAPSLTQTYLNGSFTVNNFGTSTVNNFNVNVNIPGAGVGYVYFSWTADAEM